MATEKIKLCTSEKFKKDGKLCGVPLLLIMTIDGKEGAYICPDCDALEHLPKSMRERIFEQ